MNEYFAKRRAQLQAVGRHILGAYAVALALLVVLVVNDAPRMRLLFAVLLVALLVPTQMQLGYLLGRHWFCEKMEEFDREVKRRIRQG